MLKFSSKVSMIKQESMEMKMGTPQKQSKLMGIENEMPIDNASLFLRTPGMKNGGQSGIKDGFLANSENKINVSPFFNKK